jgi:hypothetical protein
VQGQADTDRRPVRFVSAEVSRLENSLRHLRNTQDELKGFLEAEPDGDEGGELVQAMNENEETMCVALRVSQQVSLSVYRPLPISHISPLLLPSPSDYASHRMSRSIPRIPLAATLILVLMLSHSEPARQNA